VQLCKGGCQNIPALVSLRRATITRGGWEVAGATLDSKWSERLTASSLSSSLLCLMLWDILQTGERKTDMILTSF
jgi:hypothetical protein